MRAGVAAPAAVYPMVPGLHSMSARGSRMPMQAHPGCMPMRARSPGSAKTVALGCSAHSASPAMLSGTQQYRPPVRGSSPAVTAERLELGSSASLPSLRPVRLSSSSRGILQTTSGTSSLPPSPVVRSLSADPRPERTMASEAGPWIMPGSSRAPGRELVQTGMMPSGGNSVHSPSGVSSLTATPSSMLPRAGFGNDFLPQPVIPPFPLDGGDLGGQLFRARADLRHADSMLLEGTARIKQLRALLSERELEITRHSTATASTAEALVEHRQVRPQATMLYDDSVVREQAVRRLQQGARAFLFRARLKKQKSSHRSSSPTDRFRGRWRIAVQSVEAAVGQAVERAAAPDLPGCCLARHVQLQLLASTLKRCALEVDQKLLQETIKDVTRCRASAASGREISPTTAEDGIVSN